MERLGNSIEGRVGKTAHALEKGAGVLENIQRGCTLVGMNLFLCAFFGWGVFAAVNALRIEGQESADATVVRLNESHDPELGLRYTSVVEFEVDGRRYSAAVGEPTIPAEHEVGQVVAVRYDPDDPQTAQVDDILDRWLFPAIIIPTMLLVAGLTNFLAIRAWRRGEDFDLDDE
jgi:hypothetical protein